MSCKVGKPLANSAHVAGKYALPHETAISLLWGVFVCENNATTQIMKIFLHGCKALTAPKPVDKLIKITSKLH